MGVFNKFKQHLKETAKHAKNDMKRLFTRKSKNQALPPSTPPSTGTNFPVPPNSVQGPAPLPPHLAHKPDKPGIANNENPTNPWTTDELPSSPRRENNSKQQIIELMKNENYVSEVIEFLRYDFNIPENTKNCITKQRYNNYDTIINTIYNCITTPKNISDDPVPNTSNNVDEQNTKERIAAALITIKILKFPTYYTGGYKRKSKTQRRRQRKQRK